MTTRKQRTRAKLRKKGEKITLSGVSNEDRRKKTFAKQSWQITPPPPPSKPRRRKKVKEPDSFYGSWWGD
jgi:hypothetical protein